MQRHLRSAFSALALVTACLVPPALTRTEREALARKIREETRVEERIHRQVRQSHEAFAFLVLGLDYRWKLIIATLAVPLSRRPR